MALTTPRGRLRCAVGGYNTLSCGWPERSKSMICGNSLYTLPIPKEDARNTQGEKWHFALPQSKQSAEYVVVPTDILTDCWWHFTDPAAGCATIPG